jgi:tetratricopeptide (TPR) repeat protein
MDHPPAGLRVSHYQLVRKIGSGGMGDVYLARDLDLERQVAIKFLSAPADSQARLRLLNEARAAASLDHPGICAVHEVGHDPDRGDFIVMQYVEGETLAAALGRGPLGPDATLSLAADVAEALASAHLQGVVHRDLKPHNIVMQPSGRAKLLDFGISKRVLTSQELAEAATALQLTGSHAMVGTPGYMAPEQIQGKPADPRSDLFALGCVLYECLTGRRAFTGATAGEVFGQVLHAEPPAASAITPNTPSDVEAFVARLLRKAPAERFQSASEVIGAVRTLRGLTTRQTSTKSRATLTEAARRRPMIATAAGVTIVLVIVAGVMWWRSPSLPTPSPEAAQWYQRGIEALRDGTYASARAALEEAVRLFPNFPQAYSRLAEACAELDDENAAQEALLRLSALAPENRLPADERLRVEAVRSTVLREHEAAIKAYAALVDRHPNDAGLRVDAGRAQEAAGHLGPARDQYARALAIDPQYAAAHMRLAYAEGQLGPPKRALDEYDEAIRLYRTASRVEGEAEALVRKGSRLAGTGDLAGARASLEQAIGLTSDKRYLPQRIRGQFHLARVTMSEGRFADGEKLASDAVDQATAAGLERDAAEGLIDLSNSLAAMRRMNEALAALQRSIALASARKARRTEMRARLQMAFRVHEAGDHAQAVSLAAVPLKFYGDGRYLGLEAQTKTVISRAKESLEEYEEARQLAFDALRYAESVGNQVLIGDLLENLAGQLTKLGRLPEALKYRERLEGIHREQAAHGLLKFDLPNRAELLIRLGRDRDARVVLDEVKTLMASGNPAYADRARRVALFTALLASTGGRYAEVEAAAQEAIGPPSDRPDGTALFALVLREHARAELGRSREAVATISSRLSLTTSPVTRRELVFWVARTLIARREGAQATALISAELETPALKDNVELRWRLNALAERAVRAGATPAQAAAYRASADEDARRLTADWAGDATAYFARPDLAALRQSR